MSTLTHQLLMRLRRMWGWPWQECLVWWVAPWAFWRVIRANINCFWQANSYNKFYLCEVLLDVQIHIFKCTLQFTTYMHPFTDRVLLSPSIDDSLLPFHLTCTPFFFFQFLTLFRFLHSQWSWGSLLWNQAVLLLVCKASLIDSTVTSWEKSIKWVCRSKCKIGNIIQNEYKYKLTQYLSFIFIYNCDFQVLHVRYVSKIFLFIIFWLLSPSFGWGIFNWTQTFDPNLYGPHLIFLNPELTSTMPILHC